MHPQTNCVHLLIFKKGFALMVALKFKLKKPETTLLIVMLGLGGQFLRCFGRLWMEPKARQNPQQEF